ncbi:glycoside hydrolase family 97 protein [soil metagenome]
MMKHRILAGLLALGTTNLFYGQSNTLQSPDGRLVMTFSLNTSGPMSSGGSGHLQYALTFKGKPIVDASALGLDLDDKSPLGSNVTIIGAKESNGTDDYPLLFSKVSHVHEAYNSLAVTVQDGGAGRVRKMTVEARAYNTGIAFRYVLPAQGSIPDLHLRDEETEFRFSQDDTAWVLSLPNYRSSYESEYVRYNLSALSNQGGVASKFLIGLPALLHQPGGAWMSLMEADLEGNSSAYVTNPTGSWAGHMFRVKLSPRWDDPSYAVTGTLPHHSAWRVLGVADTPGELIESNLQTNLNPQNRLKDTSWIKPGKASWNWWVDNVNAKGETGNAQFTTETMKYYVDFAAKSGFPYFFLDAGWSSGDITKMNGKVDIPELVRYAATKKVKVWIWLYSTAVMAQMKEAFPLYEKWGVAGMKIDFVNRDDQEGINFFYDVARVAAENHLMVDFHGCHTPWGIMRTYPNVMSYESVLGLENNKVGRRDSPVDRAVFAWTRALVGPMDYTAGAFDNQTEDNYFARNAAPQVMGTRAQQLALYVVYENPVPMVSDSPQNYEGEAAPAFQFLKDVPTTWDEIHVLGGEVGEYSTVARRHGKEWYLGSMTNWTPRDLHLPLTFLGTGSYTAEIYEDGADAATQPKHVNIRRIAVTAGSTLDLKLAPGGGGAVRFIPGK